MGAGHAPYLYDPPSRRQIAYPYSDFDPKAVTRASWISAAESTMSKPKQEGPLIDFNRHPDSYMVVTPHAPREPLPPNTKKKVVAWRWVQFGLRVSQLLGAIGLLLCVIFVRNTETAQGWIMRVPVSIHIRYHEAPLDVLTILIARVGHCHLDLRRLPSCMPGQTTHSGVKC